MHDDSRMFPVDEEFDPLGPDFIADPAGVLANLPRNHRVFYAPSIDHFVLTRFADIESVCLDPLVFSSSDAQVPTDPLIPEAQRILLESGFADHPSIISLDPPEHTRLRIPAAQAFSRKQIDGLGEKIRAAVAELLSRIDRTTQFDLVSSLATPLPTLVVFSFVGIPEADWPELIRWGHHRSLLTWGRVSSEDQVLFARSVISYRMYLQDFVQDRVKNRGDDFTSSLLSMSLGSPAGLTLNEIGSILYSLTFAGHETTKHLIGNTVRLLLEKRQRWNYVIDDPALVTAAVDETLRYESSVATLQRTVTQRTGIGDIVLEAGDRLLLWLFAAGRDDSVVERPNEFDLQRKVVPRSLAFGKGIHHCLGAALGRLEVIEAVLGLMVRFPNLRLVENQELTFQKNLSFRGTDALWVVGD